MNKRQRKKQSKKKEQFFNECKQDSLEDFARLWESLGYYGHLLACENVISLRIYAKEILLENCYQHDFREPTDISMTFIKNISHILTM